MDKEQTTNPSSGDRVFVEDPLTKEWVWVDESELDSFMNRTAPTPSEIEQSAMEAFNLMRELTGNSPTQK